MNDPEGVAGWHQRVLHEALAWRERNPHFRFNLRTGDVTGQNRLAKGYYFTGTDRYLFFAPFHPNDNNNRTRTIGFVVRFDRQSRPKRCYLEVVFGTTKDETLRSVHKRIVSDLGPWKSVGKDKYQRAYTSDDPIASFREFLSSDYPRLCDVIRSAGQEETFFISEQEFNVMLARVNSLRASDDRTADIPRGTAGGQARNLILFGPPGTGKTHWLRQKFDEYTDAPAVVDEDTWLQELVANYGWRSVIAAALSELGRPVRVPEIRDHRLVRAKARQRGRSPTKVQPTLWVFLQEHTPESVTTVNSRGRREPFIFTKNKSGEWELLAGWQEVDEESVELARLLRAGRTAAHEAIKRYRVVTFHPSFSYEDFVRGIRPVVTDADGTTQFRVVDGIFKRICDEARANPAKRYALFIDEINRANIAKVFGELITLIEPDKRAVFDRDGRVVQGMAVQLASNDEADGVAEPPFGVPSNLDIYGTMNTADRSIALLDVALRRRFEFQEMEPNYALLERRVGEVHLGDLLRRINDRLEYLLDRDHRIGHAYLLPANSLDGLCRIFRVQIVPLLQEYFFDDLARVAMVLATDPSAPALVARQRIDHTSLFSGARAEGVPAERSKYVVTPEATWTGESFRGIYVTAERTAGTHESA